MSSIKEEPKVSKKNTDRREPTPSHERFKTETEVHRNKGHRGTNDE